MRSKKLYVMLISAFLCVATIISIVTIFALKNDNQTKASADLFNDNYVTATDTEKLSFIAGDNGTLEKTGGEKADKFEFQVTAEDLISIRSRDIPIYEIEIPTMDICIYAFPDDGYAFIDWSYNKQSNTYTANFKKAIEYTFKAASNGSVFKELYDYNFWDGRVLHWYFSSKESFTLFIESDWTIERTEITENTHEYVDEYFKIREMFYEDEGSSGSYWRYHVHPSPDSGYRFKEWKYDSATYTYTAYFVDLNTYYFEASAGGTVNIPELKVSADFDMVSNFDCSLTSNIIEETTISATASDGYHFTGWTYDEDRYTYTANFEEDVYYYSFKILYNGTETEIATKLEVAYGDVISCELSYSDNTLTISIGSGYTESFSVDDGFYMSYYTVDSEKTECVFNSAGATFSISVQEANHESEHTIKFVFDAKSYNVGVGEAEE